MINKKNKTIKRNKSFLISIMLIISKNIKVNYYILTGALLLNIYKKIKIRNKKVQALQNID